MEIKSIAAFLSFYERTRRITLAVIKVIPPDKLDWTYRSGKFTIGDLVRHIAAIERNLFVEIIMGNRSAYTGCGKNLADGYPAIITYFNEMHEQSLALLGRLKDSDLERKIKALDEKEISIARFLNYLIVHEIHHRAVLCLYLNLLEVQTPAVIGFTEEQVIQAGISFNKK